MNMVTTETARGVKVVQRLLTPLTNDRLPQRVQAGTIYANACKTTVRTPYGRVGKSVRVVVSYDGTNDHQALCLSQEWALAGARVSVCALALVDLDHIPMGSRPLGLPNRCNAYEFDPTSNRWLPTLKLVAALRDLVKCGDRKCREIRVFVDRSHRP